MRAMDIENFAIGFDHRDRERLHELWDSALNRSSGRTGRSRARSSRPGRTWNGLPAVATSSWTGAALAALEFFEVRGKTVLCPSNTFMATPLAIVAAGAKVEFVDCNRDDLCMSFDDFERKAREHRPTAVFLVHIGGHIAFEVERIAELCRSRGDRPARGLRARARRVVERPASRHLGRRRHLVVRADEDDLDRRGRHARLAARRADRVRAQRSATTASRDYDQPGLNYRMNEFTAALGIVGVERLDEIIAWKNAVARDAARPAAPEPRPAARRDGLRATTSTSSSSRSSARPARSTTSPATACSGIAVDLPNTDWVAENHWCVPLYYRPASAEPLGEAVAT